VNGMHGQVEEAVGVAGIGLGPTIC